MVRCVESDGAVRSVTTSELFWPEAVMLDMRLISKKTRQKAESKWCMKTVSRVDENRIKN